MLSLQLFSQTIIRSLSNMKTQSNPYQADLWLEIYVHGPKLQGKIFDQELFFWKLVVTFQSHITTPILLHTEIFVNTEVTSIVLYSLSHDQLEDANGFNVSHRTVEILLTTGHSLLHLYKLLFVCPPFALVINFNC